MAAAPARRRARPLVDAYLEGISAKAFETHQDLLRNLVAQHHGIYALYKGEKLYYIGLARNLRGRVRQHLRDRHSNRWNRFSLYLVRRAEHIKELETLLLRIADPKGNTHGGKLSRATNLKPVLRSVARERYRQELDEIVGLPARRQTRAKKRRSAKTPRSQRAANGDPPLRGIVSAKTIAADYKGKEYRARVLRSGRIKYAGEIYDAPSAAAKAITGRYCSYRFWWVLEDGDWIRLSDVVSQSRKR